MPLLSGGLFFFFCVCFFGEFGRAGRVLEGRASCFAFVFFGVAPVRWETRHENLESRE